MFSDAGPDIRWCGNERGVAGDPNWSTVDPHVVTYPGQDGPGVNDALQHGHASGTVWRPAEVDVSIRRGWFHHPADDATVRSVDDLADLYFTSVGRNAKLLLNVPPTRDGLLHDTDVARLAGFRARLDAMFATTLPLLHATWRRAGPRTAVAEWNLNRDMTPAFARLGEDITRGQRVAQYALYGERGSAWNVLSHGATIGHAKLDRLVRIPVRRVRLVIEDAVAAPEPVRVVLYQGN
jgi:alpha-L-fucosidase